MNELDVETKRWTAIRKTLKQQDGKMNRFSRGGRRGGLLAGRK